MKITAIENIFVDRYLFVQVHTDEGIVGLGESGTWGFLEASAAAVLSCAPSARDGTTAMASALAPMASRWRRIWMFSFGVSDSDGSVGARRALRRTR